MAKKPWKELQDELDEADLDNNEFSRLHKKVLALTKKVQDLLRARQPE